jgi:hypothetical protein
VRCLRSSIMRMLADEKHRFRLETQVLHELYTYCWYGFLLPSTAVFGTNRSLVAPALHIPKSRSNSRGLISPTPTYTPHSPRLALCPSTPPPHQDSPQQSVHYTARSRTPSRRYSSNPPTSCTTPPRATQRCPISALSHSRGGHPGRIRRGPRS